jgi:hypothetical protein
MVIYSRGLESTDVWLKSCGTVGKPGAKRRKQTSTCIWGETGQGAKGILSMASSTLNPKDTCTECGAPLSAAMRHCPTCRADAGAPNVRACRTDENLKALIARYDASRSQASVFGCSKEFSDLEAIVEKKSGVVVSMPAGVARNLFENPNFLYTNYERLVGVNARRPADADNDRQRWAVGGLLFGSYADCIVYGALSLTKDGVGTYGDVHCRLRSVTIKKRTSFLETNSYRFVRDHGINAGGNLPVGYRACWQHRQNLVLAKLSNRLSPGQTESDWQAILIQSDSQNRENDDFVEAHIYEGFDRNAIESLVKVTGKKLSKSEKLDIDLAIHQFERAGRKTK